MMNIPIGEMLLVQNSEADKSLSNGKDSEPSGAGFVRILETLADQNGLETSDPETKDTIPEDVFLPPDGFFAVPVKAEVAEPKFPGRQEVAAGQSASDDLPEKSPVSLTNNITSGHTGNAVFPLLVAKPEPTSKSPIPYVSGRGFSTSPQNIPAGSRREKSAVPAEHQQESGAAPEWPKSNLLQLDEGSITTQNDMSVPRLPVGSDSLDILQAEHQTIKSGDTKAAHESRITSTAPEQLNTNRQSEQTPGKSGGGSEVIFQTSILSDTSRGPAGIKMQDTGFPPDETDGMKINAKVIKSTSDTGQPDSKLIAEPTPGGTPDKEQVTLNTPTPKAEYESEPLRSSKVSAVFEKAAEITVKQATNRPEAQVNAPHHSSQAQQDQTEFDRNNSLQIAATDTSGQGLKKTNGKERQYQVSFPSMPQKQTNPVIPPAKPLTTVRPADAAGKSPNVISVAHSETTLQIPEVSEKTDSAVIADQPDRTEKETQNIESGQELQEIQPEKIRLLETAEPFRAEHRVLDRAPVRSEGTIHRPEMARHIAQQLSDALPDKPDRPIEVSLNPAELGRVRMTLTMSDGNMNFAVHADRVETADLMRRHIETLAQEFRDMGFGNISFDFSDSRQGSWENRNRSPLETSGSEEWIADVKSIEPVKILVDQADGLDLRL